MIVFLCIGALALVLVLNLALTLGLATRVRTLQEEVVRGASRDPSLPRPGDAVGAFEVTTTTGERLSDATLSVDTQLVGYFAPGCADCTHVRSQLLAAPPEVPFVAFIDCSGTEEAEAEGKRVADQMAPIAKVALTRLGEPAMAAFREAGVPTLILVERGIVVASGHRLNDIFPEDRPARAAKRVAAAA